MNNLISIGPPTKGVPDWQVPQRSFHPEKSDSFEKVLSGEISQNKLNTSKNSKEDLATKKRNPELESGSVKGKESAQPERKISKAERSKEEVSEAEFPDEEGIEEPSDLKGKSKKVSREKLMQNFMDSLESEIGIPPTRLVEAMASLNPEEMNQSPEITADNVIDQLNLPEAKKDQAKEMYLGLLFQLKQVADPVVPKVATAATATITEQGLRAESIRQRTSELNHSLDLLNENFWSQADPLMAPDSASAKLFEMTPEMMNQIRYDQPVDVPEISNMEAIPTDMNLPAHLKGQLESDVSPAVLRSLNHRSQVEKKSEGVSPLETSTVGDLEELNEVNPWLETATEGGEEGAGFQDNNKKKQVLQNLPKKEQQALDIDRLQREFFAKPASLGKSTLKQEVSGLSTPFKENIGDNLSQTAAIMGTSGQPLAVESFSVDSGLSVLGTQPGVSTTSQNHEANIQKIMNQAQYLVNRGGGEMKVQMNPEGLGEVHLKVLLKDGKVNVQMQAESTEAKKAIESSLSDLKTSLASHKLSVENVKVDVVGGTSTDTSAQNSLNNNNGQQNFEREGMRQFWNQYQDQFGSHSQRNAYFDVQNPKSGYRKNQPLESVESATAALSATQARKVDGRGGELNLVA